MWGNLKEGSIDKAQLKIPWELHSYDNFDYLS